MTDNPTLADFQLRIEREVHIDAPIAISFDTLLEHVGPGMARPDGVALPLRLEAAPGGRWYRDLENGEGHLWGHVQAIKRPTLLELCGPMFMSLPTSNNVQYRLEEVDGGGTTLKLVHTAFGPIPSDVRNGLTSTWDAVLARIGQAAARVTA